MKAQQINMADWVLAGGGAQGESYNHISDPAVMLKLFSPNVPTDIIERELTLSQNIYDMGLPTPLPGKFVTNGSQYGLIFQRIQNKKSFARAIADDPSSIRNLAERFAEMNRGLHATTVDKRKFSTIKDQYARMLEENQFMDADEKASIGTILAKVPEGDTCVHGDLHYGNVITDGKKDYYIDLGTFGYGNPDWDNSMIYFTTVMIHEDTCKYLFHINTSRAAEFWKWYKPAYYGPDAPSDEEFLRRFAPYIVLRTLFFEATHGPEAPIQAMRRSLIKTFCRY